MLCGIDDENTGRSFPNFRTQAFLRLKKSKVIQHLLLYVVYTKMSIETISTVTLHEPCLFGIICFIHVGAAEASQIFLQDAYVPPKLLSYEERTQYYRRDQW
jgi:hypothetical protein